MAIKIQGTTVIADNQDLTITGIPSFNSTGALKVPVGTDGERPTGVQGQIRYNTTQGSFEGYNGAQWAAIGGADEYARTIAFLGL